jgi:ribosomal protein S18 acetylase RimI-like enzyme
MIRRAVPEDAATVTRIQVASWRAAYRGIVPDAYLDGIDEAAWGEKWPARLQPDAPGHTFLGGAPELGVVSVGPSREPGAVAGVDAEIYLIYVLPEAWGTGVGRALLVHALADLTARGFARATLWVFEANARARRFYDAAGGVVDAGPKAFEIAGERIMEVRYRFDPGILAACARSSR